MKKTLRILIYGTICFVIAGLFQRASAQVSITAAGTAHTQNFNGLITSGSAAWSNNSTIGNWYADKTGSGSLTVLADDGSLDTKSLYSYGTGSSSDRALGFIPSNSGIGSLVAGVRLENNTGSTLKAITVTYTVEQWRIDGSGNQEINFSYRTSTGSITSLTSGSWTEVTSLDFSSYFTGEQGAVDGNSSNYRETISYTIYNVNLANGSEIMLRWRLDNASGRNGIGIDDVTIEASNPSIYYSKSSGNLNLTSSWGTSTNGSGTNPSNFTTSNCIYVISNNSTPTLGDNWVVSGSSSKVILGTGSSINFTIPSSYSMTGTIDLSDDATLTVNNTTMPTINRMASTSQLVLGASGSQTIPGGTYYTLTISGGGTKTLSGAVFLRNTLTFSSGKLSLSNYNFTMANDATISGASSSNYIITGGTGSLVRNVDDASTSVSYPVGTSTSYNPVTLSQPSAGTTDNFGVRVFSGVSTAYNSSDVATGSSITSHVVKNTWAIDEETSGGSSLNITLQWNASDEGTSFVRSSSCVLHYTGGAWATASYSAASGSGPYTRQLTGVTSFSPFGVGDNVAPLPVEWLSFNGTCKGADIVLDWATASEKNNKGFEVERKGDGDADFVQVGFVDGHNTTANVSVYSYNDFTAKGSLVYYRLKQVDFNGDFAYSRVIAVQRSYVDAPVNTLAVYPNPATDKVMVTCNGSELDPALLVITDLTGKQLLNRSFTPATGFFQVEQELNLAAGTYLLQVVQGENVQNSKLIIQ